MLKGLKKLHNSNSKASIIVSCSYHLLHTVLPGTFLSEMRKNKSKTSDQISSLQKYVGKEKIKKEGTKLHTTQ
jgi:hypothetical protein